MLGIDKVYHAIWNPEKCLEGVFCPKCNCFMDDYYEIPDECPRCGVKLSGAWIDGRELNNNNKEKEN